MHKTPITQISDGLINTENDSVPYQQIMVATGFEQDFMSQPLIKQLIQIMMHLLTNVITLLFPKN